MDRQAMGRGAGGKTPGGRVSIVLDTHLAQGAAGAGLAGLAMGARVATLEGQLPVEYLTPGDRVITRAGTRVLRAISALPYGGPCVRIEPGALGHDRPGQALILGAGTQVLLRDWRAQALFGAREALVGIARLIDERYVVAHRPGKLRLFALHFDEAEVIYADGVEVGATPLRVQA